jgi:UDP-N-acetyl-D-mannosaminuronic acid dehydrogenase
MSFNTISVIGLGYIGLPTAAMFASHGINVIGVDTNQKVVETINQGKIHIVEPNLDAMVHASVSSEKLRASMVIEAADAFLIAVPTPFKHESLSNPQPDLKYIKAASQAIGSVLKKGDLIILESTSPVGATEQVSKWLSEVASHLTFPHQVGDKADVNVAHCPERVLPGQVVRELVDNDRIIGGLSDVCSIRAKMLYEIFVRGECVLTNARTAEMSKLTENACRDVQIAFANELSIICDDININVWELISLANRHPRINILNPGPGVGGHCIAVDPWFIVDTSPKNANLIKTARQINDGKPNWVEGKVKKLASNLRATYQDWPELRFWGVAFKPDIDDLRESPALEIVSSFCTNYPGDVKIIEPNIKFLPKSISQKAQLITNNLKDSENCIDILLVAHKEFYSMKTGANVVDACGILEKQNFE